MPLTSEQERIASRQELLEFIFRGLQEHLDPTSKHLELNRTVLYNIVVSYFEDVDRHKEYHGTPRVDSAKQGAYSIKWIAKLRPIQLKCAEEDVNQELLYINEIYALRCGLSFMRVIPAILPGQLYDDLLYTLRYRHIDERMLLIWLETLRHAIDGSIGSYSE